MSETSQLLEVVDLVKHYRVGRGAIGAGGHVVHAVDGVSFSVGAGETLALVGESGSGKTTIAKLVLRLVEPTSGSIRFGGQDVTHLGGAPLRSWRRQVQIVFQDPYASLDPRLRVRDAVAEPLVAQGRRDEVPAVVPELLDLVGLGADLAGAFPHELSGGQRQRVAIARALAPGPQLVVLDEPVSTLDVSVQAQVLNLLADLQERLGVAYLLVSHDLGVVRHLADRTAVMHLGRLVEIGAAGEVHEHADHPYTRALLSAIPSVQPAQGGGRIVLQGETPSAIDPPSGCRFRTRCWMAESVCATEEPRLVDRGSGHPVACHFAGTG